MRILPTDPGHSLIVSTDGASRGNPGPAGYGVSIAGPDGTIIEELAKGIGIATNNVAEYTAALEGLRKAAELGAKDVLLRSDSRLLIEQLSGRYRVKNPTLQRLHAEARKLAKGFERVRYEHVRRELNKEADRLANLGVDEWLDAGGDPTPPGTGITERLWEAPESGPRDG
ncbi:MAG: ribonuclease HI family protein [Actinomycetota bacterium]